LSLGEQVIQVWAVAEGYANGVDKTEIQRWGNALLEHITMTYPEVLEKLNNEKILSDEIIGSLKKALESFQFN
jgi:F0F1-type ATP synthase alpha subunit